MKNHRNMTNSQGERISIAQCEGGEFEGRNVLKVYDDAPSKAVAYHLLDEETIKFLLTELEKINEQLHDN